MEQLEKEIVAWHTSRFPDATIEEIEEKVAEEVQEFLRADTDKNYWEELADVFITHAAWTHRSSNGEVSLTDIIRLKFKQVVEKYGEKP